MVQVLFTTSSHQQKKWKWGVIDGGGDMCIIRDGYEKGIRGVRMDIFFPVN